MSHLDLGNYYQLIWTMSHHYHYSIKDLEDLYPFERDIYLEMTNEHVRKLEESQQ